LEDSQPEATSIKTVVTEVAEAEIDEAYRWLLSLDFTTAERWLFGLTQTLEQEAALLSATRLRRPVAPDSAPDRPLFVLLYRSGGRKSSPWHLLYELADEDFDGKIDTLLLVRVRHAKRGTN
jgi:hypothetical protein